MAKNDFVTTPASFESPDKSYKGGDGTYNGLPNLPPRTKSPNAVPEKLIDGNVKAPKNPAINSY